MKIRLFTILFATSFPLFMHAQEADQFKTQAVLIMDESSELSMRVSALLMREMSRIQGLDIRPYSAEWEANPQWSISVSLGSFDPEAVRSRSRQKTFYMAVAISRFESVVSERVLRRETSRLPFLDEPTLIQALSKARFGIGEFKAMWLAHGQVDTDLEQTCRDAVKVFDENFLAPERQQFYEEKAKRDAQRRARQKIR